MFNSSTNKNDQALFAKIVQEAIQLYGINIKYYVTSFNTSKKPIFAEDTKPKIIGEYKLKAYGEVIEEDWLLTRFGLGSNDILLLHIDIKEFTESVGDFEPKSGDYIWVDYMSRLFVITDIRKKESNIFLQKKFVYNIHMKAADISGEEILSDITTLTNYENLQDNINDNSSITIATSGTIVEKIGDRSIFGDWE